MTFHAHVSPQGKLTLHDRGAFLDHASTFAGRHVELVLRPVVTVAWVDVETTGFSPAQDEIIEVAIALTAPTIDGKPGPLLEEYHSLQDPGRPIPPESTRVHRIQDWMVRGKQADWDRIARMLSGASAVIAHNATFDGGFLTRRIPDPLPPLLCTQRGVDWKDRGFHSERLQSLLKAHNIVPEASHRALGDVRALIELFQVGNYFSTLTNNSQVLHNNSHEARLIGDATHDRRPATGDTQLGLSPA